MNRHNVAPSIIVVGLIIFAATGLAVLQPGPDASDIGKAGLPSSRFADPADFWNSTVPPDADPTLAIKPDQVIGPVRHGFPVDISAQGDLGGLRRLSFLEGLTDFPGVGGYGEGDDTGPPQAAIDDMGLKIDPDDRDRYVPETSEKGDYLNVAGDRVYCLDPNGPFVIVDIADRMDPRILSSIPMFGKPVEAIVHGGFAYVLVETFLPAWNVAYEHVWDPALAPPTYRLSSRLVVIDLTAPEGPAIERSIGLEGFSRAMCRFGDTLYVFSNCYGQFKLEGPQDGSAMTKVVAFDLDGPSAPRQARAVLVNGRTELVLATPETFFLIGSKSFADSPLSLIDMNLTVVSSGYEGGTMASLGTFEVGGHVSDVSWLTYRDGFLFLVSTRGTGHMSQFVRSLNATDPDNITWGGSVELEAHAIEHVLIEGDNLCVLHLATADTDERRLLEVVNTGDPRAPILASSLLFHMHKGGLFSIKGELLAISSAYGYSTGVLSFAHLSIDDRGFAALEDEFDVRRTCGTFRIGLYSNPEYVSTCEGLDMVFVPFSWEARSSEGTVSWTSEISVVRYDAQSDSFRIAGDLTGRAGEGIATPHAFLGSTGIGWTGGYLQTLDLTDLVAQARSKAILIIPEVLDARLVNGLLVRIVTSSYWPSYMDYTRRLWITEADDLFSCDPILDIPLGGYTTHWFWSGGYLIVFRGQIPIAGPMNVTVSSIDLTHPARPVFGDALNLTIPMEPDHLGIYTSDNRSRYSAFELVSSFDNPVLVERRALVLVSGGAIYVMNVSNPMDISLVNRSVVEYGLIDDFLVAGRNVLIFTLDGHLTRVDLADPYGPSTHPTVKIPGIPLGAAASGDLVFTYAHWTLPDQFLGYTLNVVRIENETAEIVWAVQLQSGWVAIEGERAYITSLSPGRSYYSDDIYGVTNDTTRILLSWTFHPSTVRRPSL